MPIAVLAAAEAAVASVASSSVDEVRPLFWRRKQGAADVTALGGPFGTQPHARGASGRGASGRTVITCPRKSQLTFSPPSPSSRSRRRQNNPQVGQLSIQDFHACAASHRLRGCFSGWTFLEALSQLATGRPPLLEHCLPYSPEALMSTNTLAAEPCRRTCNDTSTLTGQGRFAYIALDNRRQAQEHICNFGAVSTPCPSRWGCGDHGLAACLAPGSPCLHRPPTPASAPVPLACSVAASSPVIMQSPCGLPLAAIPHCPAHIYVHSRHHDCPRHRRSTQVLTRLDVYDDLRPFFADPASAKAVYRVSRGAKGEIYHAVLLIGYNNEERYWLVRCVWHAGRARVGRRVWEARLNVVSCTTLYSCFVPQELLGKFICRRRRLQGEKG